MEDAALMPPQWLERIVLALIPPQAREAVAGDLCETYQNPRQYAVEAARTLPFVIFSQVRRNLNLPALVLKLALAWAVLDAPVAACVTLLMMMADAWQPAGRPDAKTAIRATMIIALLEMAIIQGLSLDIGFMLQTHLSRPNWLSLYLLGFLVAPLLCLLRTGLILHHDRHAPPKMTADGLMAAWQAFVCTTQRHNIIEGLALIVAGVFALLWLDRSCAILLTALYLLTAFYLLLHGIPGALPKDGDQRTLRAHYARALAARREARRFLWWLWSAPLLVALVRHTSGKTLTTVLSMAALGFVCFLLAAINREHGGWVQEEIGALQKATG